MEILKLFPDVFRNRKIIAIITFAESKEFLQRLYPMVQKLNLDDVRIRMANRMWTIPRNNMSMSYPIFRKFIQELYLKWTDFILVAVLGNHDVRVVAIDGIENREKNYEWELLIREFSFHKLNANLVCPGTFSFAEWLVQQRSWVEGRRTIELGSSLLTKQFSLSVPSKHFLLAAKCARCKDTENESQELVLSDKRVEHF